MGKDKLRTGDLVERMYLSIRRSNGKIGVPSVPELGLVLDVDDKYYTMYMPTKKICWMNQVDAKHFRIVQRISSGAKDEV